MPARRRIANSDDRPPLSQACAATKVSDQTAGAFCARQCSLYELYIKPMPLKVDSASVDLYVFAAPVGHETAGGPSASKASIQRRTRGRRLGKTSM